MTWWQHAGTFALVWQFSWTDLQVLHHPHPPKHRIALTEKNDYQSLRLSWFWQLVDFGIFPALWVAILVFFITIVMNFDLKNIATWSFVWWQQVFIPPNFEFQNCKWKCKLFGFDQFQHFQFDLCTITYILKITKYVVSAIFPISKLSTNIACWLRNNGQKGHVNFPKTTAVVNGWWHCLHPMQNFVGKQILPQ